MPTRIHTYLSDKTQGICRISTNRTGFTIVELLIVIVVIGILAAISIVSYQGIQQRANNSQTITAVNQIVKLLKNYHTLNGSWPPGVSCIGEYDNDVCEWVGTTASVSERNSFKAAIATVGSMPQPSPNLLTFGSNKKAGITVSLSSIYYSLSGASTECGAGGTVNITGADATQCRLIIQN